MQERRKRLDKILKHVMDMTDDEIANYIAKIKHEYETNHPSDGSEEPQYSYSIYNVPQEENASQSNAFSIENNTIYSWKRSPQAFFVSFKPNDSLSEQLFQEIVSELKRCHITVIVSPSHAEKYNCATYQKSQLSAEYIDLIIVVGGDGSLLYVSSLFTWSCPPIVSFNSGSLGFLAPFPHCNVQGAIQHILNGPLVVVNRNRLSAYISTPRKRLHCSDTLSDTSENQACSAGPRSTKQFELQAYYGSVQQKHTKDIALAQHHYMRPAAKFQPPLNAKIFTALNEVYINRGNGNALTNLQCYSDGYYFGTIQADGLLISTPTGSTAYALSAGGVPVSPDVNCVLFTPVCPHVMSSKQLVLSDQVLKVKVSMKSRGSVFVCFDGRDNLELDPGQSVVIGRAQYDLPTVSLQNCGVDWFHGLKRCLNWNVRIEQKQFKKPNMELIEEKIREVGDLDSDLE